MKSASRTIVCLELKRTTVNRAAAPAIERLERRHLLTAGDLDITFGGGDGRRLYTQSNATDLVALPNGKLLVAAPSSATTGSAAGLELRRYNADGSPDATFGPGGTRLLSVGAPASADLVLLSDGKILAVGGVGIGPRLIARFNANGAPDTTFGGGDGLLLGPAGSAALRDAAVRSDGRIVAAGGSDHVFRFNSDGSPDSTFGNGGVTIVTLPDPTNGDDPLGSLSIADLALAPGNTIVVSGAGTQTAYAALARLTNNGALDATFSGDGYHYYRDQAENEVATSVVVQSNGKITISVDDEEGVFRVHRLTSTGAADSTFGGGDGEISSGFGIVGPDAGSSGVYDLLIQPDGKIVVYDGATQYIEQAVPEINQTSFDFGIRRFNSDGGNDTSFIAGQPAKADFADLTGDRTDGPNSASGQLMVLTPDGDLVVAGSSALSDPTLSPNARQSRFALARFQGTDAGPSGKIPLVRDASQIIHITGTQSADRISARSTDAINLVEFNGNVQRLALDTFGYSIDGRGGDDVIFSDAVPHSNDPTTLIGGTGNDTITGGPHLEVIQGGDGNDVLRGGKNDDTVTGGAGPDALFGDDGNDNLDGGAGNDYLAGLAGNDLMRGGAENDTLDGSTGNDTFFGDTGTDTADNSNRGFDLKISLNDLTDDGPWNEKDNVHGDIETVIGGSGRDRIVGDGDANLLIGNGGNDTLTGGAGDDVLDGGSGNDIFNGNAGIDTADYSSRGYSFRISLNDLGDDVAPTINETDNVRSDVENVLGGSGNDSITGSAANNRLVGNNGNDTITGLAGIDQLLGSAGNDRMLALDGLRDTVDGGSGTDIAQRDNSASVSDVVLNIESFI